MRVAVRVPFFTNPCRRLPPKIPNPLPKSSSRQIPVEYNCRFHDLQAATKLPPSHPDQLPPLLHNPVGRGVSLEEVNQMRQLRAKSPKRWTITALSHHFGIHRGYIIRNVLKDEERAQADEELVEHVDFMPFNAKRGWLMRYRIREHRRDITYTS